MHLRPSVPDGPIEQKWEKHRFEMKLVQPGQQAPLQRDRGGLGPGRRLGRGLAGRAGLQREVLLLPGQPAARPLHRRPGRINAAKNYQNDGDSVFRLFYDTVKGGRLPRAEANVYRLAELSVNIIDQCVAQGVPFAREYGGTLANRSFGGAQVSRTFYARGQTGQQLLLGRTRRWSGRSAPAR
jgi:succinate dehydrogenase / fumarate reductase flavoprotein subunit